MHRSRCAVLRPSVQATSTNTSFPPGPDPTLPWRSAPVGNKCGALFRATLAGNGTLNRSYLKNNISLAFSNIRGLNSNLAETQHFLTSEQPDIFSICETFLTNKCPTPTFPSYDAVRLDRQVGKKNKRVHGGGILILVKSDIPYKLLRQSSTIEFELLTIIVKLTTGDLLITSVYRPPSASPSALSDELTKLHHHLFQQHPKAKHIIIGDFNCHNDTWLGSATTDPAGREVESMALLLKMQQLVKEPTHYSTNSSTHNILDLLLTTHPDQLTVAVQSPIGNSDHCLVTASLSEQRPRIAPEPPRTVFNYRRANWNLVRNSFYLTRWNKYIHPTNVSLSAQEIEHQILQAMHSFIPHRTLRPNSSHSQPWFTERCSKAQQRLLYSWTQYKRNPTPHNLQKHQTEKKNYRLILNKEQRNFSRKLNEKLSASPSSPAWWKHIRKLTPPSPTTISSMHSSDGTTAFQPSEIASILNNQFVSNSTNPDSSSTPSPSPPPKSDVIRDIRITRQSVLQQLKQLDISKAVGPDGIPNTILKKCAHQLAHPLAVLFRQSLRLNEFPSHWKVASVVPIYKNGPRDEASNYRPISLLPSISKVLESLINSHIVEHLEQHQLLSPVQFGFRAKRSTCDLLATLTQKWNDTMDKGGSNIIVTLDFSKAFDRVWHEGLLSKLPALGINGQLLTWLTNYLSNRSQYVVYRGSSSNTLPITAGVPQGSVLGPTLFLLSINDLPSTCRNNIYMYADDCTLYRPVAPNEPLDVAVTSLQQDLDALSDWANSNKAKFNPSKCEVLLITRKRNTTLQSTQPLSICNTAIPIVEKTKILGLLIDNKLIYSDHIHRLATSSSRALGLMVRTTSHLQEDFRARLYKALVRPLMEYASPIWCGTGKNHLQELFNVQNRAFKLLRLPPDTLIPTHNLPPLHLRYQTASILLFQKHFLSPPIPSDPLVTPTIPSDHRRVAVGGHERPVLVPPSRTSQHRQSFVPRTSRWWNDMPFHVASCIDLRKFGTVYYRNALASIASPTVSLTTHSNITTRTYTQRGCQFRQPRVASARSTRVDGGITDAPT